MSNGGYSKLYGEILESSIWFEPPLTRLVWLTMLAMCDKDGRVMASLPGFIHRANLPASDVTKALKTLEGPDINSKSQEWGGRRIEKIDGGWLILNYAKYRDRRTPKQVAAAERQARFRENHPERYVTPGNAPASTAATTATKGLRTPSPVGSAGNVGMAAVLLVKIRDLVEDNGTKKYIRRDRLVEQFGTDVAQAYDAVGGMERVMSAVGKEHSFLTREFAAALQASQQ